MGSAYRLFSGVCGCSLSYRCSFREHFGDCFRLDGRQVMHPALIFTGSSMNELLILFFLILLNGFFSMAEIALVSARKARLEGQSNKGDNRAKQALRLANKPESFFINCTDRHHHHRHLYWYLFRGKNSGRCRGSFQGISFGGSL